MPILKTNPHVFAFGSTKPSKGSIEIINKPPRVFHFGPVRSK